MSDLQRYDPFGELDDLFRGFFVRPMTMEQRPHLQIKMDVSENEKAYVVKAEVPGASKEDINISIDGNQVAISAEVKQEKEAREGEKLLRQERYYGKVYRAFSLAQDVDEATAGAKYDNGVLVLTLPKRQAASAKKLRVE
ncbi:MAG TPA: Hsp20/alpha crystallin family protein [Burkholderiales bacterium]|nr:Hsp20/alpha crystallin family protein [Burkholderiales bacterium]